MSATDGTEAQIAAQLIERLLTDPSFRARFRRDPAAACREAGLDELAQEMSLGAGNAMMTLDVRESKSSLAGVMMAAAMEGVGIYEFTKHVVPELEKAADSVAAALSHVNLPAIQDVLGGGGGPAVVSASGMPLGVEEPAADADAAAPVQIQQAAPAPEAPEQAAADGDKPAADGDPGKIEAALAEFAPASEAEQAAAKIAEESASGMPDLPADEAQFAPVVDESAQALLDNPRIQIDEAGIQRLTDGEVDPRAVAALTRLSEGHELSVGFADGGGVDIRAVDGEVVRAESAAARELATALSELDQRPERIGTPFAIAEEGYFSDAAHQDRIHFDFAEASAAAPEPPADAGAIAAGPGPDSGVFAAVGATPAGAAAATAGTGAAAAADSGVFQAVGQPVAGVPEAPGGGAADVAAEALSAGPGGMKYPGDDAPKELIALWMAKRAEAAGLPPELPVMATLVESNVENLDHGHSSSVGYFQMLTEIWDQGKYAGYLEDPEKQMQWFIDTAGPLKDRFGDLPATAENYGTWVADTERPAEEYRGRYELRFEEARALIEKGKAAAGQAGAGTLETPGGSSAAAEQAAPGGSAAAPDPSQYGLEGSGGPISAETEALLDNPNVHFDETGIRDLEAGKIDPRVVAALTKLSEEHEITVSCMCSDHSPTTASGSMSNHAYGRGVDIATIDGEIVRPGSTAARELSAALSDLDPSIRPDEVGTPFAIAEPGYFTDAAHQDHIHFAFKEEIASDWKPPADVAAGASPLEAVAAAAPGAPAAASDSAVFAAVTPGQASAAGEGADAAPSGADSGVFQAVGQPPAGPPSAVADPATAPAAVASAAEAAAAGGSARGASGLSVALEELAKGVKETGTNTGADVDGYLAAAGVGPGNPWCAAFVTWAMEQSGHKMEGGGWAAVQTWVRAAEAGTHDLSVISAGEARPGDIVVYDWGGQDDFGADGHIGFLASGVADGKFTAVEGNYQDAVLKVARSTEGANVKFLRLGDGAGAVPGVVDLGGGPVMAGVEGSDVAAGAAGVAQSTAPAAAGAAPGVPAVAAAAASASPLAGVEAATPGGDGGEGAETIKPNEDAQAASEAAPPAEPRVKSDSAVFAAVKDAQASARGSHGSAMFLAAIDEKMAALHKAGATPEEIEAAVAATPDLAPAAERSLAEAADASAAVSDRPPDDASPEEFARWLADQAEAQRTDS